ncbi:MAG: hypothetical protein Q8N45_01740, partial [Anaerolineales bacterium]|nr:hypothetical protein [Anaerolineales bacterium]
MNREPISARQAIQNARQELQDGNRQAARRWAEFAAAVAPDMEAPWLILAGLASPRSSITYLNRALQINPKSERARQGMRWAIQRLREEEARRTKPTPTRLTQPVAAARKKAEARGAQARGFAASAHTVPVSLPVGLAQHLL